MKSNNTNLISRLHEYIVLARAFKSQRHTFLNPHIEVNVFAEKLNLIYISISKTGNSSIRSLLLKKMGEDYDKSDYKNIHKITNLVFTYITKKEVWKNKKSYKFSFVRNPFDRLVSCYKNKILEETYLPIQKGYVNMFYKGMPFDEFVNNVCEIPDVLADRHFKSQYSYLYYKDNLIVDYVGKFENMSDDFKVVKDMFLFDDLPHINKSSGTSDYREYYSLDLVEKVYKRYKNDVIKFSYQKEFENLKEFVKNK